MPISSVARRRKTQHQHALAAAVSIIERSGIVDLIEAAQPPKSNRGRKPSLPQYALGPILVVLQYLFLRGLHSSWANVLFAIWFDFTDDDLESIGFPPRWRSKNRRDQLLTARPREDYEPFPNDPHAGDTKRRRTTTPNSPWDNEYKRCWDYIDKALAPIDDTVASANTKQLAGDVRLANTDPATDAARALRLQCLNAIIRGAHEHSNVEHYPHVPAERLHDGILRHHKGDLAVDEHLFAVGLSKNAISTYNNIKQLSARTEHIRREQSADAIGITIATTAFRPDGRPVPIVAMGVDVHPASTGAPRGARNAIEAIEDQGMRPSHDSNALQLVTGDKAYPHYIGFTAFLLDRSYTLHAKLGEKQHKVYDLAEPGTLTTGPFLANGCLLCPGIGAEFLQTHKGLDTPDEKTMTAAQLRAHEPIERQLNAALLRTNGRPQRAKYSDPGRPKADAVPLVGHYAVTVGCPALGPNPKVRCPIIATDKADPALPMIKNPPPPGYWPPVCASGSQRVVLDVEQTKTYNGGGTIAGTWAHQDIYGPTRSRNEHYFDRLMRPNTGNLRLGAIEYDKNGPVALAIAMSIAATNLQVIDRHLERHGDHPKPRIGKARRALRRLVLARDTKRKPRRNRTGRS